MTDYFDRCEQHLGDAVERYTRERAPRRRPRAGAVRAAVPVLALAVVVVVVGVFLRGHSATAPASRTATTATAPAGAASLTATERALVSRLGVLRGPQSQAARVYNHGPQLQAVARRHQLVARLTREVDAPDGIHVFLYVTPFGLGVTTRHGASGSGECCGRPAQISDPETFPVFVRPRTAQHHRQVYLQIVPDGVTRVRLGFAHGSAATLAVKDNIAAADLPDRGRAQTVLWSGARGRVVARLHRH